MPSSPCVQAAASLNDGGAHPEPWAALAKAELHLHLDCSLSLTAVQQLSQGVSPEIFLDRFIAPERCRDLADYLARVQPQVSLLQTELALRVAAADLIRQLAADGVVYAEIRLAPLLHLERGLEAAAAVAAVCDAALTEAEKSGIAAGVILCTLRHFSQAQSMQTAELAIAFMGRGVIGLDIAGDEAGFDLSAHKEAFAMARQHGVAITAHAGEASGARSIWQTLEQLQPNRIGHGVRAIEDQTLVGHLARSTILLEVCPTCNVQIGIYPNIAGHPVRRLTDAGVKLSINTDTRTTTPTTLSRDFARLADVFGWKDAVFRQFQRDAVAAGFLGAAEKEAAMRRLERAE